MLRHLCITKHFGQGHSRSAFKGIAGHVTDQMAEILGWSARDM